MATVPARMNLGGFGDQRTRESLPPTPRRFVFGLTSLRAYPFPVEPDEMEETHQLTFRQAQLPIRLSRPTE